MTDVNIDYSQEVWKPVDKFNGLYEISNMGRLRSLDKIIIDKNGKLKKMKGKILTPSLDTKGYYYFKFRKPEESRNERKNYRIHRLVAEAFMGQSDLHIDHINSVKNDNRLSNLQYVSIRENSAKGQASFRGTKIEDRNVHFNRFSKKWVFALKTKEHHMQERFIDKSQALKFRDIIYLLHPELNIRDIKIC